jgi:hypothetical protein
MRHFSSLVWTWLLVSASCSAAVESPTGRWRPKDFFADADVVALVLAAEQGNVQEIDRLVKRGVDVNAKGKDGMTPLLWSLWAKNKQGFQRLLERGANPNIQIAGGQSVTSYSAGTPLDTYWLEMALKHGGNPNLVNASDDNNTPIIDAIRSHKKKNLDLIIKAGADINHQDSTGNTPMMYAAMMNWFDSVYYLLEAGADYRLKDRYGYSLADEVVDSSVDPKSDAGRYRRRIAAFLEKNGIDLEPIKKRVLDRDRRTIEKIRKEGLIPAPEGILDLGLDPDPDDAKFEAKELKARQPAKKQD